MNCTQFQTAIRRAVEARHRVSSDVRSHAATCSTPACLEAIADFDFLSEAIAQWSPTVDHCDVSDEVLRRYAEDVAIPLAAQRPVAGGTRSGAWQLAAAAAALLAVGLTLRSPLSENHQLAGRRQAAGAADGGKVLSAPELGRRYVAWAEGAGSLVADAVEVVIPVSDSVGEAGVPQRPWIGDWLKQLEPAQQEIDQAIMYLETMSRTPAT